MTSKQGKDAGTGMYLKTDFNYLHTTNYSSFEKRIAEKLPVIQGLFFLQIVPFTIHRTGDSNRVLEATNRKNLDLVFSF